MPAPQTIRITFNPGPGVPAKDCHSFQLPMDGSNPQAWSDFLKFLLEHPEIITAFLQLLAMLLGGLNPPPPPTP